jgi:hypothetical protein
MQVIPINISFKRWPHSGHGQYRQRSVKVMFTLIIVEPDVNFFTQMLQSVMEQENDSYNNV